jgi:hypothetical protein
MRLFIYPWNYFFVFAKYFKSDEFIRAFLFNYISLQNRAFVYRLVLSILVEQLNICFVLTSASASEILLQTLSLSPNKLA